MCGRAGHNPRARARRSPRDRVPVFVKIVGGRAAPRHVSSSPALWIRTSEGSPATAQKCESLFTDVVIGIVHPGEMGAAVGRVLVDDGHDVGWASEHRSDNTRRRAGEGGLADLRALYCLKDSCAVVLSVCPPHVAVDVAREMHGCQGVYVDVNAVSPSTAEEIGEIIRDGGADYVDGGIIGPPPRRAGTTRLYLSGARADVVAALFAGSELDARVLGPVIGAASALKMTYAAWSKGTNAMVLAVRAAARSLDVEDALLSEWALSQPALEGTSHRAAQLGLERGWRWAFELDEAGRTFADVGLPDGFGAAAADIFRRLATAGDVDNAAALDRALSMLTHGDG